MPTIKQRCTHKLRSFVQGFTRLLHINECGIYNLQLASRCVNGASSLKGLLTFILR